MNMRKEILSLFVVVMLFLAAFVWLVGKQADRLRIRPTNTQPSVPLDGTDDRIADYVQDDTYDVQTRVTELEVRVNSLEQQLQDLQRSTGVYPDAEVGPQGAVGGTQVDDGGLHD